MLIPKLLTLIFIAAAFLAVLALSWAAWTHRNPQIRTDETDQSPAIGPVAANRWLRGLRLILGALIVVVLTAHVYWVMWADSNPSFVQATLLDSRSRRLADSGLKGWVLDRNGSLDRALIRYRSDRGTISREYPLGRAAAHLTGYADFMFGSGGIEYAYRDRLVKAPDRYAPLFGSSKVGEDLSITIDSTLQRELFDILQRTGKPAAAAVILLPEDEVVAMASTPSFDPLAVRDEREWLRLIEQADIAPDRSPLVNRAIGRIVTGGPGYYFRPGSTFKLFTAAAAVDSGITEERFTCKGEGFVAPGVTRPIRDFGGEVHGTLGLDDAFRVSCNQYFAQLGLKVGRERLKAYARRLGIATDPDEGGARAKDFWRLSPGGYKTDFDYIFAPPPSRLNLSSSATNYDVALQSFGQGYADLTVIQMAALAASVARQDGMVAMPALARDAAKKTPVPFVSPQSAERLRRMLRSVVEGG